MIKILSSISVTLSKVGLKSTKDRGNGAALTISHGIALLSLFQNVSSSSEITQGYICEGLTSGWCNDIYRQHQWITLPIINFSSSIF